MMFDLHEKSTFTRLLLILAEKRGFTANSNQKYLRSGIES
jgi:hypothetical protein